MADPGDTVSFTDANLQACVNKQLRQQPGSNVTEAQLASLPSLVCINAGVTTLDGLEFATGLTSLTLIANQIVDVKPLSGLTRLSYLSLTSNQIANLEPLSGLTGLTNLSLSNNRIADLTPLSGLTGLSDLMLASNKIADASPLAGLTGLTGLTLTYNQVVDISPLNNLNSLTFLGLIGQRATAESAVAGVPTTNPVRDLQNAAVPLTNYCVDSGCEQLNYPNVNIGIPANWSTPVTIGSASASFTGTLSRDVKTPVPPTLSGTPTPGIVGTQYSFKFDATGVPSPSVTLLSGDLPDGLGLSADGELTGIPTDPGDFTFTLRAENIAGSQDLQASITVVAQTLPPYVVPTLELSREEAYPGEQQTITGTGFTEGEELTLTMFSDPVGLGKVTVGTGGVFTKTFTIPATTQSGAHRIVATRSAGAPVEATFAVLQRSTPGPSEGGVGAAGKNRKEALAESGSPALEPLGWTAVALLVVAATLFARASRGRIRTPKP